MRPKPENSAFNLQSPTSPLDKDEVTGNTETVQSPAGSDVVNESTQSDKPNKVYFSTYMMM